MFGSIEARLEEFEQVWMHFMSIFYKHHWRLVSLSSFRSRDEVGHKCLKDIEVDHCIFIEL